VTRNQRRHVDLVAAGVVVFASLVSAGAQRPAGPLAPERIDYLTFAQGAVPIAVRGAGAKLGASFDQAIRAVDGDPAGFVLTLKPGDAATDIEFIYHLPAPTRFDRFAIPNVLETPSPSATFTRQIEVHGSAAGPEDGYVLLGSGTLATHKARGEVTELTVRSNAPVRWVKLRLLGGLQVSEPQTFFEFSEIIGNGTQQTPAMSEAFHGVWKGRGVLVELRQDGPVVSGCYDTDGQLTGTVTGSILKALGRSQGGRIQSAFVLSVSDDGALRGVRSANRAPFGLYAGETAPAGSAPKCPPPPPASLGCGSVVHGITFEFDSAAIRPESEPVIARLVDGLRNDPSGAIAVEGHTSSEGSDEYNQRLSEQRAQAVVASLVKRGSEAKRLTAVGVGEKQPIASNNDENGRSLNRRVEIRCR
jgi:OOP family OmpA-OmpF porin